MKCEQIGGSAFNRGRILFFVGQDELEYRIIHDVKIDEPQVFLRLFEPRMFWVIGCYEKKYSNKRVFIRFVSCREARSGKGERSCGGKG